MRYILCEDGESGYYFWTLISEYVLKKRLSCDYAF